MNICIVGPFNPIFLNNYFEFGTELPNINTNATSVNLYVKGLLELGHRVTVITIGNSARITKSFIGKNIKVVVISPFFKIHGAAQIRIANRIKKAIRLEIDNVDILHAEWTYEYAYAVTAFKKYLPIYCSVRDWCPYILTIVKNEGIKSKYFWLLKYLQFKKVMKTKEFTFIANSEYTKQQISDFCPDSKIALISNPLYSDKILLNRSFYSNELTFVSIAATLSNPRKNIRNLLIAFKKYLEIDQTAKLILIGGYENEWKSKCEADGLLNNVELYGNVSFDKVFDILDKSTILVHPSLEETFGNILLEAMCRRCLCIGGEKSGAVPEILGYGKYGLLCDVTKPLSIFEAMKEGAKDKTIEKIVNNATEYIIKTYSEKIIAKKHIDLFSSIL